MDDFSWVPGQRETLVEALEARGIKARVIFDPVMADHMVIFSAYDAARLLGIVPDFHQDGIEDAEVIEEEEGVIYLLDEEE